MLKVRTILHDGEEWTVPLNADLLRLTHAVFLFGPGAAELAFWHSQHTGAYFWPDGQRSQGGFTCSLPLRFVEIHPDLDPDPVGDDEPPEERRAA